MASVFDLHVWALKPSIPLLAAHVTVDSDADAGRVLADVTTACRRQGITHTTIQVCELLEASCTRQSWFGGWSLLTTGARWIKACEFGVRCL